MLCVQLSVLINFRSLKSCLSIRSQFTSFFLSFSLIDLNTTKVYHSTLVVVVVVVVELGSIYLVEAVL